MPSILVNVTGLLTLAALALILAVGGFLAGALAMVGLAMRRLPHASDCTTKHTVARDCQIPEGVR